MQVVVKTPRIDLKMVGDIPEGILRALESEYGELHIVTNEGDELVEVTSSEWYKAIHSSITPGKVLRVYRERAGMTQGALGNKIGNVPRQHISGMETGRRPIGKEMAKKLAVVLNTSPLKFIDI